MQHDTTIMHARQINPSIGIIDIEGDLLASAESLLMKMYAEVNASRVIILNCRQLAYMNSSGIGLLVTLLIRMNRQKQRLFCYGLSEHYRHIFVLTRLNEMIKIFETEHEAIKVADT